MQTTELLRKVRRLEIRSRHLVEDLFAGRSESVFKGRGVEFLGYRFEAGRRWVRKKSRMTLKDKIRAKTRRTRGYSLARIVADLNPLLKGWYGYFQHACRWEFPAVDGFIRRRLRAMLRKHEKRPGFGRCEADHRRWPNAYFAAQGLFTMTDARWLASQSRCG